MYQLSPAATVRFETHGLAVDIGAAPGGRQSSSPGWRILVDVALLASSSAVVRRPADMAIPDQLSPTSTVCLDAHAGPDGAGAAAPAGRQISAPSCNTASALASFASSRLSKDTSADREIRNQLSPFTTVCFDAHEAPSDVGAERGAPSGRHSTSPGYRTVEASAAFAASRAPVVTPAAVATENQASPSATVYVAGAGDEAVGAQMRRIERPPASAGNAGAMKVIAMPAIAASVNHPARRPKARSTVAERWRVRFMSMSRPPEGNDTNHPGPPTGQATAPSATC